MKKLLIIWNQYKALNLIIKCLFFFYNLKCNNRSNIDEIFGLELASDDGG